MNRIICHLDMDAFFASLEEVLTPAFRGKPIVVGAEPDKDGKSRGVVSTANYKAREYGIHSAMPISRAWELSEKARKEGKEPAIFLPVDFELYGKASSQIYEIIKTYADEVEQASVDEFYFDLSSAGSFKKAEVICKKIKKEIKDKLKVTCSVGIAPNKLVAKIAAGKNKPDGMCVVQEKDVLEFLRPMEIRELPGIGPKTAEIFYQKDIHTIEELQKLSKADLRLMAGKHGEKIYEKARGISDSPIEAYREAKSIGQSTTFEKDTLEALFILDTLKRLGDSVFASFLESGFNRFNTISITVRFKGFETHTSAKSFPGGISKAEKKKFDLEVLRLILPYLDKRSNPTLKPLRLIGIRVEKFTNQLF